MYKVQLPKRGLARRRGFNEAPMSSVGVKGVESGSEDRHPDVVFPTSFALVIVNHYSHHLLSAYCSAFDHTDIEAI
jgi:hypothetical protein